MTYTVENINFKSVPEIKKCLSYFKTENLYNVEASDFERFIDDLINNKSIDFGKKEKFDSQINQNLHMLDFYWGHDHDFGSFSVNGLMGTRHIWLLSRFLDSFYLDKRKLINSNDILDVGCWTGGVSLVLSQLANKANITSIDEIYKYTYALDFLANSFNVKNIKADNTSLYDIRVRDKFDIVFLLGVLYHISDPIIGLRRIFNSMKPGGVLCLESMSVNSSKRIWEYEGPSVRNGIFGWNWFIPSPKALEQVLYDTGFVDVKVGNGLQDLKVTNDIDPLGPNRVFAFALKDGNHQICKAGLSVDIT